MKGKKITLNDAITMERCLQFQYLTIPVTYNSRQIWSSPKMLMRKNENPNKTIFRHLFNLFKKYTLSRYDKKCDQCKHSKRVEYSTKTMGNNTVKNNSNTLEKAVGIWYLMKQKYNTHQSYKPRDERTYRWIIYRSDTKCRKIIEKSQENKIISKLCLHRPGTRGK